MKGRVQGLIVEPWQIGQLERHKQILKKGFEKMKSKKTSDVTTPKIRKPRAPSPIERVTVEASVTLPNGISTTRQEDAWRIGANLYATRAEAAASLRSRLEIGKAEKKTAKKVDIAYRKLDQAETLLTSAIGIMDQYAPPEYDTKSMMDAKRIMEAILAEMEAQGEKEAE